MNQILIERGIPVPNQKPRGFWPHLLQSLQPGDSFLVPDHSTRTIAAKAARVLGLSVRTSKENKRGFRVWRLS